MNFYIPHKSAGFVVMRQTQSALFIRIMKICKTKLCLECGCSSSFLCSNDFAEKFNKAKTKKNYRIELENLLRSLTARELKCYFLSSNQLQQNRGLQLLVNMFQKQIN